MSAPTLTVDEDVEDDTEYICVDLYIESGGIVECELSVHLFPYPGTAGKSRIDQWLANKIICILSLLQIYHLEKKTLFPDTSLLRYHTMQHQDLIVLTYKTLSSMIMS